LVGWDTVLESDIVKVTEILTVSVGGR
jgi:hypothetical protein